jgi:hypothetical protein
VKLTVSKAAENWIKAKELEAEAKALLEPAAEVLKAHLRKTGKPFRNQIALSMGARTQLDQAAVKAELGDRLSKFQKRVTYEFLVLLER